MKTGRVRSKETAPVPTPTPAAEPVKEPVEAAAGAPSAPRPAVPAGAPVQAKSTNVVMWVFIAIVAVIACIALATVLRGCGGAEEWVPVSRATGNWTTTVQVLGPQVQLRQMWQTECQSAQGLVQAQTCVQQDTGRFGDQPVEQYEEFAYAIYWDETYSQVYEAQGTEFVVTELGGDDRVQGNRRYVTEELLKSDTCQQTEYTVWVDDPENTSQEVEVYLFDCEVWNRVEVYEQVQALWCQCELTSLVPMGVQTGQGTGTAVSWPAVSVPAGGRSEQAFQGSVVFVGQDYTLTVTTQDPAQYQDWLTGQYYLGIRDGKAIQVRKNPPEG